MERQNSLRILAAILLTGALCLLCSFFFTEPYSASLPENTEASTTLSSTDDSTVDETTVEETTTEGTTIQETTEETTQATTETQESKPIMSIPNPGYSLSAKHAFVYDVSTGTYLYQKGDSTQHIAPASITKLFTAYVALQYLEPNAVITVGSEVEMINPASTTAFILKGHQISVEMCVQGMMLPSGNDAAYILAVAAGRAIGGEELGNQAAVDAFMNTVNQTAQLLGMNNTHFVSPDGIDRADHYTCTKDLLTIASLALQNRIISRYANVQNASVMFESGQTITWTNTNLLLDPSSKYYHPDAHGLKTGTTSKAGACLLAVFQGDNGMKIVGVFGCPTNENRYEDALHLYRTYG